MALLDLWKKSPQELGGKRLAQILGLAGSGRLKDDNDCSQEFREFLASVPTDLLVSYGEQCLTDKFEDGGLALQDIVNQYGHRLGFSITEGRYRGVTNKVGFDGIWKSPHNKSLIVEVKTTDAYRIDLNVIAGYRRALVQSNTVTEENSSVLIVVGRQDTGDLEQQIRGSKHAWDIRLISLSALARLVRIKEGLEAPEAIKKIYDILLPREYTKLDGIVDLVFSTTEEARETAEVPVDDEEEGPKFVPVNFHEACASRIAAHLGIALIRHTKATFGDANGSTTVVCSVSREYSRKGAAGYWFAFHPHQREMLATAREGFVAFGCGSSATIVLIPFKEFDSWIDGMNVTRIDDRMYWHVHIRRDKVGTYLDRKKGFPAVELSKFVI